MDKKAEEYILEFHPDQFETFKTCKLLHVKGITTEHYWCYLTNKVANDLYAEEPSEFMGVFKESQNGCKMADYKIPYPSEKELEELIGKDIIIKKEDLSKSKWQLLAEAFIHD